MKTIILIGRRPSPAAMSHTIGSKTKLYYAVNMPGKQMAPMRTTQYTDMTPKRQKAIDKYMADKAFRAKVDSSAKAKNRMKDFVSEAGKKSLGDALHSAANRLGNRVVDNLADNLTGNDKGITISAGQESRPIMPVSAAHSVRRFTLANDSESRHIHKTVFTSGFYPSKGVRLAAKTHGTGATVLFDSKIDARTVTERDELTQGSGFNQKGWHVPCLSMQLPKQDVERLCVLGFGNDSTTLIAEESQLHTVKTYVSIIRLKRQFMIHNTSVFLPLHMKITVAKYIDSPVTGANPITSMQSAIMSPAEITAVDAAILANSALPSTAGKTPWQFIHGGFTLRNATGGNYRTYCDANFSLKGQGPWSSAKFREAFELVESFEKTISPGDFWNFSHVHNMGGGLRLEDFSEGLLNASARDTRTDPFTYMIWFEAKGQLAEGVFQNTASVQDTYLGASPTFYSYEAKTSAYYVKANAPASVANTTPSSLVVHRREYFSDPIRSGSVISNSKKEFFVERPNIVSTGAPAVGQMFIPMTSGSIVQYNTTTNAGAS